MPDDTAPRPPRDRRLTPEEILEITRAVDESRADARAGRLVEGTAFVAELRRRTQEARAVARTRRGEAV
jgi:hypothetical protein